jgi:AraC-like DNA-binding protein
VAEVFGERALDLEPALLSASDEVGMAAVMDRFLGPLAPVRDGNAALAEEIVTEIAANRELARVEDVAAELGVGIRWLQRLFATYVGAGPKWVIQRSRMHEVLTRAASGASLGQLAADLGYADQAHLTRDFVANVGLSPGQYLARTGRPTPALASGRVEPTPSAAARSRRTRKGNNRRPPQVE